MRKILVTGANGQLGQCIQKKASQYPNLKFVFKDSRQLDITDVDNVHSVFDSGNFSFCINCAAYTDVEGAEKNS